MATPMIPLSDAIAALRTELSTAVAAGAGQDLRFEVGPIELALDLVVEREAGAGGKINFKLFGWGADASLDGKVGDHRTVSVKMTLTPVGPLGSPVKVLVADTP